jgi:hypothetical protein
MIDQGKGNPCAHAWVDMKGIPRAPRRNRRRLILFIPNLSYVLKLLSRTSQLFYVSAPLFTELQNFNILLNSIKARNSMSVDFVKREEELTQRMRFINQRYASLNEARIRASADEERLVKEMRVLEEEAEKLCGTKDPDEIMKIYEEKLRADEKMVDGYLKLFAQLDEELKALKSALT